MDNKGQGERLSELGVGKAVVKCLVCCTFDSMALCIRRSKVQAVVQGPSLRIVSLLDYSFREFAPHCLSPRR